MKKIYFLFLLTIFAITSSRSQSIISFAVNPPNPTPSDTITIITQCMFPSGACDGSASMVGINGNIISVDAFHCMGMLTVICSDYDTVVIPPLPAAQYSLVFSLSAGHGFPCTPGIVIDDIDTLNFTVEDITGINHSPDKNNFQILPNPSDGKFTIKSDIENETLVKIFSVDGKIVKTFLLNTKSTEIESSLPPGIYFVNFENEKKNYISKLIIRE